MWRATYEVWRTGLVKARDVMTTDVVTASPETPIAEIAALLLERRISGLPIVGPDGQVLGILSEGDLLRRVELGTERRRPKWLQALIDPNIQAADFAHSRGLRAADVMSRDIVSVTPDTDLAEIARLFEQRRIKRVPVIDNGRLVGIISRANLLRGLVAFRTPSRDGTQTDQTILQALHARLANERWLDLSRLNLIVSDGVVPRWGPLKSEEQQQALEVAARSVPGVRDVQNHTIRDIFTNDAG
jgi:CBS domain-containing protein